MNTKNILIINYKNYDNIYGESALKLAKIAERVAKELDKEIIVAPPTCLLAYIAKNTSLKVFAQHVDNAPIGSTTGFVIPEVLSACNVKGSIINHSEHRIDIRDIEVLVNRLRMLGMTSIVCARTPEEVKELSIFKPDYIAIEPPELIGSGIAVSKTKPDIISRSISLSSVDVICGAGLVDGSDVEAAIMLGSKGVLVASGIIKSSDWYSKITEMANKL